MLFKAGWRTQCATRCRVPEEVNACDGERTEAYLRDRELEEVRASDTERNEAYARDTEQGGAHVRCEKPDRESASAR